DSLTVVAVSDNGGVVEAFVSAPGIITLSAINPGAVTITVTVEDGRGGTTGTAFRVTVEETPPPPPPPTEEGINLNDVPNITDITGDVLKTVRAIYRQGMGMPAPVNPGIFSVAGDLPPAQFLFDLGDGSANFADLPDAADLDNLVFYFTSTPLPVGGNSFTDGGSLSTNLNWTARDLVRPASADPAVCQGGESPLACELRVNRPAVVFIFVGRNDILTGAPIGRFETDLDVIIQTCFEQGVIPVLTTIPGDPAAVPALQEYNTVIVETANAYNIPLLNVWRVVANRSVPVLPDLTLTGPGDVFTSDALKAHGAPLRNLIALRQLAQLMINVPIP
ncbi:MAG: SGNH/GDSL hydrolase family protein, partial [Anaerolineae bacterium]|nr:SGNH/GDSL hydrolase family protein [Anaerolineae bacterium]